VQHALRRVPPDEVVKNSRRWRLPTIIAALERSVPAPKTKQLRGNDDGTLDLEHDRRTLPMFDGVDELLSAIKAEKSKTKRRARLSKYVAACEEACSEYRAHCKDVGFEEAGCCSDLMYGRLIDDLAPLFGCTTTEVWHLVGTRDELNGNRAVS
jgi:hypothetical protein